MAFDRRRAGELSLDQVDGFLASERTPADCMQRSELDGFLAAIAVGPELVMPSEWLPVIWGDGEPEYEGIEEAQQILYAIMARYNQILDMTRRDPEAYQPILATMGDGGIAASQWAAGFMSGVALRRSAWEPLIESEEDQGLVAPIVALLRDEHGRPMIESEGEELAAVQEVATELLGPSVVAIDRFWKARRWVPQKVPKIGRNDPCPCGSGRKYKRCCGAS